jgi:opacity protein-like surface antigen
MKRYTLTTIIGIFTMTSAQAQVINDPTPNSWYIGSGLVLNKFSPHRQDYAHNLNDFTATKSISLPTILVGYKFNELALEAGYKNYGGYDYYTNLSSSKASTNVTGFYIAAEKVLSQINQNSTLYGKLNMSLLTSANSYQNYSATYPVVHEKKHSQISPSIGLGVNVNFMQNWMLKSELEYYPSLLGHSSKTGRFHQLPISISIVKKF